MFIGEDFILESDLAIKLFEEIKDMPIVDFHSHLQANEIYENLRFKNITEAWLYFDHYKWRQMRTLGIDEKYITGQSSDLEKFVSYAETLDYAIGNPLIAWSQLELKRFFGIDEVLGKENAKEVYDKANAIIETGAVDVRTIITNMNVKLIATTDDICDDLKYHKLIREDNTIEFKVKPTYRPDRFINIEHPEYKNVLADFSKYDLNVNDLTSLKLSFLSRMDYFQEVGCNIADHGISEFDFMVCSDEEANNIFTKYLNNKRLTKEEEIKFKSNLIIFFAKEYKKRNWVMQLHIGATRNNNDYIFNKIGADAGADAISDTTYVVSLSEYFKELSKCDSIGKTVIYNLNPMFNYSIAAMIGAFQQGPTKGLIQFGSGWWFNDQRDGMEAQLKAHSQLGLLRVFIGMLTDSRSFLSLTRHEYFRRILCNYVAELANSGQYPNDLKRLKQIVSEIAYDNAQEYFDV